MKSVVFLSLVAALGLSSFAEAGLVNTSFETNNVGGGYAYAGAVTATGWTFANGAGVSANGTAWGGTTTSGSYFAFLQDSATVAQSFNTATAANLNFSFDLAQRSAWNRGGPQTIAVYLDAVALGTYTPLSTLGWDTWGNFSGAANNVAAGTHTLSFVGTNPLHAFDTAVFLDNVALATSAVPESASYGLLGLGLLVLATNRRRKTKTP